MSEIFTLTHMIGASAALLSVASFLPQAWKIIRTGDIEGVSKHMYFLTASGFLLWLIYGVIKSEWPLIVPNSLCFLAAITILILTLMPQSKRDTISDKVGDTSSN